MTKTEPHVTEVKRKEVEDIKRFFGEYKVLALANLENLPAFNYMKIKTQLKGKIVIKYTKKRLMKIAFDEIGDKELEQLKSKMVGIPTLLFTNEDPFQLFQILKKTTSPAAAKPGDLAPLDIIIPEGPTDFTPGPMIGELGAMGIKTKVEGGKIHIREDKLLVEAGKEIDAKSAELMSKMKMEPMSVGLNLVSTYKDGEILDKVVLDIDADKYYNDVRSAAAESFALALSVGYVTSETVEMLIKKAVMGARKLAKDSGFLTTEDIGGELAQAEHEAEAVSKLVGGLPEEEGGAPLSTQHEEGDSTLPEKEEKPIEEEKEEKVEEEPKEEVKTEEPKETKTLSEEVEEQPFEKALAESNVEGEKTEKEIKPKNPSDITQDDIKKAQDKLKELTEKKIRGEL